MLEKAAANVSIVRGTLTAARAQVRPTSHRIHPPCDMVSFLVQPTLEAQLEAIDHPFARMQSQVAK